jgi:thiol-disulfide isomerase/thioredoxin
MKHFIFKPVIIIPAAVLLALAGVFIFFSPLKAGAAPSNKTIAAETRSAFTKAGVQVLREKADIIDFTVPLLEGGEVRLSSLKGKVVFLNFWATWCPPCREEMPSMETLYRRFRDSGLEFLAVDIQEGADEVADFMRQYKLSFPVGLDSGRISAEYGIRGIPTTFIIDRDGAIIIASVGGRQWDTEAMFAAFERLLGNGG